MGGAVCRGTLLSHARCRSNARAQGSAQGSRSNEQFGRRGQFEHAPFVRGTSSSFISLYNIPSRNYSRCRRRRRRTGGALVKCASSEDDADGDKFKSKELLSELVDTSELGKAVPVDTSA